ncbi:MAG TPA: hypothetical protein VK148_04700 [Xanthobacteraceae bacterium]|jgi:hypothetical protein|nr:hypothetical protein [Xanthobacteraceae bacterium]
MKVQRLDFILSIILIAASATLALGQFALAQAVPPAGGPAQNATSIPDFSGKWVHPYFPGFEPPASGPGPVVNKSRRRDGVGNANQFVGDYTNPILKPHAAEVVRKHGEISLAGASYPTPSNQCWPSGLPYIFFQHGMQMLQLPQKIVFLYLRNHEYRQVRLNQPHPAHVTPSWNGDSVGHYEGATLVIDTVGVKADRPFAMVDMYGTPFSPAMHVVERYRLIDYADAKGAIERNSKENIRFRPGVQALEFDPDYRGKHLQLEFTVEDEGVFTKPWTATITYSLPLGIWDEHVCAENRRGYFSNGSDAAVPTAGKPDF